MSIIKFFTEENPAACCGVLQYLEKRKHQVEVKI